MIDNRIDPPLTVTVTRLPLRGGDLLANVNRWRGQLGLPAIASSDLSTVAKPLESGHLPGTIVDLVGAAPQNDGQDPQRMLAAIFETDTWIWFFKATETQSIIDANSTVLIELYQSVREGQAESSVVASPQITGGTPGNIPFDYTLPDGWHEDRTPRPARITTFHIESDSEGAELAVTQFPGDVGGELANVNRWRGQLSLPATASIDDQDGNDFQMSSMPGRIYRFAGPAAGSGEQAGIHVAFVERAGHIWFFKMTGPVRILDEQKDHFEAFLRSIRFSDSTVG